MNVRSWLVAGMAVVALLVPAPGRTAPVALVAGAVVLWAHRWASGGGQRVVAAVAVVVATLAAGGPVGWVTRGVVGAALASGGWLEALTVAGAAAGALVASEPTVFGLGCALVALRGGVVVPPWPFLCACVGVVGGWAAALGLGRGLGVMPSPGDVTTRAAWVCTLDPLHPVCAARKALLGPGGEGADTWLDALWEREGPSARWAAVRALVRGDRASLAEAVGSFRAAKDSLGAWGGVEPWRMMALSLALPTLQVSGLPWPTASAVERDALVAEYAARLLQELGLEAQACTLSSLPQWRSQPWARYVVWKAHQPWEEPSHWIWVGRERQPVPSTRWVLARGQPARGVWPVLMWARDDSVRSLTVDAELWSLYEQPLPGGMVWLANDLRSPLEDRNAQLVPVDDFREEWFVSTPDVGEFWERTLARVRSWGGARQVEAPGAPPPATPPSRWEGTQVAPGVWEVRRGDLLTWTQIPPGPVRLVARGQWAQGRWPIAEVRRGEQVCRVVVDGWTWTRVEIQLSSGEVLSLRFVNDFWDSLTGQDRNLWVAGLEPA